MISIYLPPTEETGVHELGYNPIKKCPLRKGIIPTITIVDGTLEKAPDAAAEICKDANAYAELYLKESPAGSEWR